MAPHPISGQKGSIARRLSKEWTFWELSLRTQVWGGVSGFQQQASASILKCGKSRTKHRFKKHRGKSARCWVILKMSKNHCRKATWFQPFGMVDATKASGLKRIISNQHFRRESVSKSSLLKSTTFFFYEEDRLLSWSVTIFEQPALTMQLKTHQTFQRFPCTEMTFKISTQDGIKHYYLQVKYPKKTSWKICTSWKLRNSVQRQTVLAVYDQEIDRNLALPSYQRLKTMERRHIDWMKRTRNFRAWNQRIEDRGIGQESQREKVSVEMRVGEWCQWKATGQCSRGDSHSFSQTSNHGQKAQSSSLAPKAQTWNVPGEKVLLDGKVGKRVLTEVLKCPHRNVYEFVV